MEFKEILLYLMNKKGVTVKQMSNETGISIYRITNWLNGKTNLYSNHVLILKKYFNVSCDFICGLEDENGNKINNPTRQTVP